MALRLATIETADRTPTTRDGWRREVERVVASASRTLGAGSDELAPAFAEAAGWSDEPSVYEARKRLAELALGATADMPQARWTAVYASTARGLLESLEAAPKEPLLLNYAGVLLYELWELPGAEALFRAAAQLEPGLPGVKGNLRSIRERKRGEHRLRPRTIAPGRLAALGAQARAVAALSRAPGLGGTISLCMIVRDEEEMLPRSLAAAAPAVDEIVVVDTGSTDRSVEIAESFGARVVRFPWNGSFADARNVSLDNATGEWVLWLDADEVIAEGDAPRLRALARKTWREGFSVRFVNHLGDGGEGFVHSTMRLFRRRPGYRFEGRIHEQHTSQMPMHLAERFETTDVRVDHHGYRAERVRDRGKSQRNRELLEQVAAEGGGDPFTDYNLGTEYLVANDPARAIPVLVSSWASEQTRRVPMPQYVPSLGVRLVQAHRLAGDPAAGLAAAEDVLALVPGHTDAVREAALCARELGDLDRAAGLAEQCLALGDAPEGYAGAVGAGTFLALALLAAIRADQRRFDEAEALLAQSLRDHPRYTAAEAALADVRGLRVAEELYAVAAAADAGMLGRLLAEAAGEALPALERHLYQHWHRALAGGAPALGIDATPAAAKLLDRLLGDHAFNGFGALAAVWATSPLPEREKAEVLATLYLAHGFLDSAAEEWLRVAQREPDARAFVGLARVAEHQGLAEDAATLAASALELDPGHEVARAVLARAESGGAAVRA